MVELLAASMVPLCIADVFFFVSVGNNIDGCNKFA